MPEVSVIIPNFNHAAYLKQRIDSVLNQTYTDFELIILDDCSTDNSKEIIEQYRNNEKVSCIVYNDVNSGNTFKQWDKGIQLAKGEYVWMAESDDWCENIFLETIVNGLEKNSTAAFGYCQSFCVNDKNEIIFQSGYSKLEDYYPADKFLERFLCLNNAVFNASMAVFKKSFYVKISKVYQSYRFAGDWIFWAEFSRLGTVYINAKPLNYFRKHDKDVSGKMYATGANFIEEIKALDYFHNHLGLNRALQLKAKAKLYSRYIASKKKFDAVSKQQIRLLFFKNISFLQKQYIRVLGRMHSVKMNINEIMNTAFKIFLFV